MPTSRRTPPAPKRVGRPTTIGARKGQVSLDNLSWSKARTIGDGNVSAGIRKAIAAYRV